MNRRKTRFNYVILSDLHLAEGKKKATGQISRFEAFLFDRPFERLLLHLQEKAEQRDHLWTLVFNGDLIDFLRITSIPDPNHPPKGLPPITPTKQKYGLGSSAAESKWQLERVVEGHPVFFGALARFLLQGHRVVILKGKFSYMSPEQVRGLTLDRRSDIYSLGLVIFEMATGRRPFQAKTVAEILALQRNAQPPDPTTISPTIPGELAAIILRCLAKDPAERIATAKELEGALHRVAENL